MADRTPMTETELQSRISTLVRGYSLNREDGELSNRRKKLQRYYHGAPYGDEKRGRSKVVTREVMQTVRWSLPWVVRSCLTGRPVAFDEVGPGDVEAAEQETAATHWAISRAPNAFEEQLAFAHQTLLMPNAYMQVWWDDTPEYQIETFENRTEEDLLLIDADPNVEILDFAQSEDGLFEVVVRKAYTQPRLRYEAVPEEEMLVAANATALNLDEAPWVARYRRMPETELIAMGFDEDLVASLPSAETWNWKSETQTRKNTEDELRNPQAPLEGMREVAVVDWYGFVDFDGDGYAERRRVMYSRDEVLINDYVGCQPFISAASSPQPHRHVGMSQAETALPWQRVASELARQGLNNLYRVNQPRYRIGNNSGINWEQYRNVIPDGYFTMDDINDMAPEIVPPVFQHVLAGQEFVRQQVESDSGVNKVANGLDAKAFAASTMGAYLEASGQASAVLELVVRAFAECGIVKLYQKAHYLLRTQAPATYAYRDGGAWKQSNPRTWNPRESMTATVGTGTGTPQEKIAAGMSVFALQREALQVGLTTKGRIYNTLQDLVAQMGKQDAARYFLDPDSEEAMALEQQAAEAQQAAQAQQREIAETVASLEAGKLEIDANKAMADAADKADQRTLDWAKFEADTGQDVLSKGIVIPGQAPVRTEQ